MSEQQVKGSNIETYHLVEAYKVAKDVLQTVKRMLEITSSSQRSDYKWILATTAKLSFFLKED